jgi:hypothetical protein
VRFDAGAAGAVRVSDGDGADVGKSTGRKPAGHGTGHGGSNQPAGYTAGAGRLPGDRVRYGVGDRGARGVDDAGRAAVVVRLEDVHDVGRDAEF